MTLGVEAATSRASVGLPVDASVALFDSWAIAVEGVCRVCPEAVADCTSVSWAAAGLRRVKVSAIALKEAARRVMKTEVMRTYLREQLSVY